MKNIRLNTLFLEMLQKKFPNKAELVEDLSYLLDMDKVSVYRRLREEVRFTVDEMGFIAKRYAVSLDELLDIASDREHKTLKFEFAHLIDKRGILYDKLEDEMIYSKQFTVGEDSELGGAIGILTRPFFMPYKELTRYFLFKSGRYYTDLEEFRRFETVTIDERLQRYWEKERIGLTHFNKTYYIWDSQIIPNLVRDLKYYESIDLISKEENRGIKEDILRMLDKLEQIAIGGKHPETGNKFELYTASMNINTTHTYVRSGADWGYYLSVYVIRTMFTFDPKMCMNMKHWIGTQKASSILISESGEKERMLFFNRQRQAVEML
ncbi:hypothetical protein LJC38_01610 [Parabacteroides sp. OttesenSCG-928-K15]|nr:hypothetical protein [Parabacteroides sp. OttesenSCG-928-K15]